MGKGKAQSGFNAHRTNPEPRLAVLLTNEIFPGSQTLNVWATLRGKHVKVLNVSWNERQMGVMTFRRGEWEAELLAMGGAGSVPVH